MTCGPFIDAEVMLNSVFRVEPGTTRSLSSDLIAAHGLARATLPGPDGKITSQPFAREAAGTADFDIGIVEREDEANWVAITVEDDDKGMMAYSDLILIDLITVGDVGFAQQDERGLVPRAPPSRSPKGNSSTGMRSSLRIF